MHQRCTDDARVRCTPVSTPVRYTPISFTPVRCTPVKCTPVKCTPVRCTPARCTPVRYTPVRYKLMRCTPMRYACKVQPMGSPHVESPSLRITQISKPRHVVKNKPNLIKKAAKCSIREADYS